ncbi:plasmid partitioning protein RepB [Rhizobium leguminosarum]|uniref:plasmid partitioning protein RepB n=1 Tax=Rhizobium leguminosarum TaxID=384 RepID=UPI001C95F342|nr:plasmid partitioning protein RepB [Rhizobium leguminosarum]MBY5453953.1 plasmid partitioning protein RepB [Rhizobium leguminosarum]
MSRKDTLRGLLSRREQELPSGNSDESEQVSEVVPRVEEKQLQHIRSGAVGAMGRSLGNIANAADQARAMIAAGSAVVELDPAKIEGSFVSDRLTHDGEAYDQLVEAIRDTGQKSPILVRPHPSKADRYQIAYGHRRVRVLAQLGRQVKAVVQNLSDEELVVVQGQENSARADLSYIERALFALALEAKGYDRRVIMAALSMEKTQLSKLMTLGHSLPRDLIEAIGPAPKAGRPRWAALAEKLPQAKAGAVAKLLETSEFKAADTDGKFDLALAAVSAKPARSGAEAIKSEQGVKLASVERKGTKISLQFDDRATPEFAEFVMEQLRDLHATFLTSKRS